MTKLNTDELREQMDMPDPHFPIKLHDLSSASFQLGQSDTMLFPPHWHEHMEILYFVEGEAEIRCNYASFTAKAGDVVIINCNDVHQGYALTQEVKYHVLIADLHMLLSQTADAAETKFIRPIIQSRIRFHHLIGAQVKEAAPIFGSLDRLIHEFREHDFGYELAIKSEMFQILSLLVRSFGAEGLSDREFEHRHRNLHRFEPVIGYVRQHYLEQVTVEQLASIAGLSRFHFSRLFHDLTGQTVTVYLNKLRIQHAERLLLQTDMTVSEIAFSSGYQDLAYFCRVFKRFRGLSPTMLRASVKG